MRRLELLVQEAKDSSDTNRSKSMSDFEYMRYFNDAQRIIQKIVKTSNNSGELFTKKYEVVANGGYEYDLPPEIYALADISAVGIKSENRGTYYPISKLEPREGQILSGYYLKNNKLNLSFELNAGQTLIIDYMYKLPLMSYRLGKVDSISGQVITTSADLAPTGFDLRYDRYSIVDKYGNILFSNLLLIDVPTTSSIEFEGDISAVPVGSYIVCGDYGTSNSQLPDACENFIMSHVLRRIKSRITASSKADEALFTQEERADIEDVFANTSSDIVRPMVLDTDYLI